jgi:hypothetical protein
VIDKKLTVNKIASKKPRREAFLSRDAIYVEYNPKIELGKKLGSGMYGTVYVIKGNDDLVVKVPNGFVKGTVGFDDAKFRDKSKSMIEDEADMYNSYNLSNEPLFIPTKVIKFKSMGNGTFIGLVRPKVKTFVEYGTLDNKAKKRDIKHISDSKIYEIRNMVTKLSHKGFCVEDDLQIGFDRHNRPLVYDFGGLRKYTISNKEDQDWVFGRNTGIWISFLRTIGKIKTDPGTSAFNKALDKYGTIEIGVNHDK